MTCPVCRNSFADRNISGSSSLQLQFLPWPHSKEFPQVYREQAHEGQTSWPPHTSKWCRHNGTLSVALWKKWPWQIHKTLMAECLNSMRDVILNAKGSALGDLWNEKWIIVQSRAAPRQLIFDLVSSFGFYVVLMIQIAGFALSCHCLMRHKLKQNPPFKYLFCHYHC